jgi:uncharacterized protein (TIGR02594 family)
MTTSTTTAWLDEAWRHLGLAETPGSKSAPRVLALYRDAGHGGVRSDSVAWCAAFVGACLARAHNPPSGSLLARSYMEWGTPLVEPRTGAVAVFSRGSANWQGHVGFVIGAVDDDLIILGGNQDDAVSVAAYSRSRLLALRWPDEQNNASQPNVAATPVFDLALDHVFDMEGGYTDDPHDPGGPTNLGITLATYATWRDIAVTPETFGQLKVELRALDRATATAIYRKRYWTPSRAADMPAALALMHLDATVNHGVTGATRLLHQALGLDIADRIDADVFSAISAQDTERLIDAYADVRTAKYRSLPHFWRFGRGWLNRVAKTRTAALALLPLSTPPAKEPPMTTVPSDVTPKWWGNSMTIWGTLLTAITTVLPAIAPLFGLDITGEMIVGLGHSLTALFQAIGGVAGTVMAIYGRIRATQPLMRRPLSLRF